MDNYLWNFLIFFPLKTTTTEELCREGVVLQTNVWFISRLDPVSFRIAYVWRIIWLSLPRYSDVSEYLPWYCMITLTWYKFKNHSSALVLLGSFIFYRCVWMHTMSHSVQLLDKHQRPVSAVTFMTSSWNYPRHFLIIWNRSCSDTPLLCLVCCLIHSVVYLDVSADYKYVTFRCLSNDLVSCEYGVGNYSLVEGFFAHFPSLIQYLPDSN